MQEFCNLVNLMTVRNSDSLAAPRWRIGSALTDDWQAHIWDWNGCILCHYFAIMSL